MCLPVLRSSADEVAASGAVAELRANLPAGCGLTSMEELVAGVDSGAARMVVPGRDGWEADPLVTLMYTSGSSGRPKGAEFRESLNVKVMQVRLCAPCCPPLLAPLIFGVVNRPQVHGRGVLPHHGRCMSALNPSMHTHPGACLGRHAWLLPAAPCWGLPSSWQAGCAAQHHCEYR